MSFCEPSKKVIHYQLHDMNDDERSLGMECNYVELVECYNVSLVHACASGIVIVLVWVLVSIATVDLVILHEIQHER